MSFSLFPRQASSVWFNIYGQDQEPTLEWSTWKGLYLGRLLPYPQTLYYPRKARQGQTLLRFRKIINLQPVKKFQNNGQKTF
jgi:hypothetical protein